MTDQTEWEIDQTEWEIDQTELERLKAAAKTARAALSKSWAAKKAADKAAWDADPARIAWVAADAAVIAAKDKMQAKAWAMLEAGVAAAEGEK